MHALLAIDPDLGALVPPERLAAALGELKVEVVHLPEGPWSAGDGGANPEHVGLLLIDGVISRDVVVSDTVSTELLGPGDIVRPWSIQSSPPLLQLAIRWNALTDARVAVLDRRFGAHLSQWPEVNAALIDRVNDRAQRLAITQAISQLNRVDRRLLSLFWHLAERWGRMTSGGVAVTLTLSHRMLGQLVGARRPTVSTAIAELAERGELVRRDDGTWLLTGEPVGIPTAEAERLTPIRRKLLGGPERDGDHPEPEQPVVLSEAAVLAEPAVLATAVMEVPAPAALRAASHELRDTLERLCGESQVQIEQLLLIADTSRRLQTESAARRERRAREREARFRR